MNISKKKDPRFWEIWKKPGAVGVMEEMAMCFHQLHADVHLPTTPKYLRKVLTTWQMNKIRKAIGKQELERIASVVHGNEGPNPDYNALAKAEGRDLAILCKGINKVLGCKRAWIIGFASDFARGLLVCKKFPTNQSLQVKKAVVWWLVTGIDTPAVAEEDKRINSLMPLVKTLFPGINYYSMTGFSQVMNECAIPVLKKLFPEFQHGPCGHAAASDEMVEISEFLPSNGYEWQDSAEWKRHFEILLNMNE